MSSLVSVVMPVYNAEKYLRSAVRSILSQSYKNLELIIINDGSTDSSLKIISEIQDPRIRLINNPTNLKLVRSLNVGIKAAKGDFIVRMDADDIAHQRRIERQLAFLKANPHIGVLGTWFEFLDTNTLVQFPTSHAKIRARLFYQNALGHPTAMINRSLVGGDLFYSESHEYAEDYELWNRLSDRYQIENLQENLLKYRLHETQISSAFAVPQTETVQSIRRGNLRKLSFAGTDEELAKLNQIFAPTGSTNAGEPGEFANEIIARNESMGVYPKAEFEAFINDAVFRRQKTIFHPKNKLKHLAKKILKRS